MVKAGSTLAALRGRSTIAGAAQYGHTAVRAVDGSCIDAPHRPHSTWALPAGSTDQPGMTPRRLPIAVKAAMAWSRSSRSCTAESCTRMRASPFGTTGKKNPMT